jgi:hypothetical protein
MKPRERFRPGDLARWQRRVVRGSLGEEPDDPLTWHYDALWRAACWEASELAWQAQQARSVA